MAEERDEVLVEGQHGGGAAAGVPLPCLSAAELSLLQQQLQRQLQQLFFDPSAECKAAANRWLLRFQRSPEAWQVARHVLEDKVLRLQQQQQDQHQQEQPGGVGALLDDQLLLLAAQTLAWKVVQQPEHLSLQEKKQLAIFLMQLAAALQQQQQQLGPQLLGPLLSRLSRCIAHCVVHCAADASVWGDAVADIVAFACNSTAAAAAAFAASCPTQPAAAATAAASAAAARAAAVRPAPAAATAAAASVSMVAAVYRTFASAPISVAVCAAAAFFTLPCCLALWSLAAIPEAIKGLDTPTRGCRRATETPQAVRCERHTKVVLDLAADVLLARAAVENAVAAAAAAAQGGGGEAQAGVGGAPGDRERGGIAAAAAGAEAAAADREASGGAGAGAATSAAAVATGTNSDNGVEVAAAAVYQQQQQDPHQRVRQRWCVEEGVLPLLVNWMGVWEQPYLQHQLLCEALAAVVSPLAAEPALTDCLVATLPKLSSYMQLWSFTTAALPTPARNGSTNAVLDGVGRSGSSSNATAGGAGTAAGAAGGGVASSGGGVYNSGTDAQQQLLLAWADPGLPTTAGEGLLCKSVQQQLLRLSAGLARKERTRLVLLLNFKQRLLQLQQQGQQLLQQQDVNQVQQQQVLLAEERRQLCALQQQLNDGAELALLLRWGSVVQTLVEGFPAVLLEEPAAAARCAVALSSSSAAAGVSAAAETAAGDAAGVTIQSAGEQAVCGELLLQLWRQQPQTWLCASNVWGVVKELRRDQLLPPQVLQLLLQRLAPTCINSLLQHCRRDSPWWRWGSASRRSRGGSRDGGGSSSSSRGRGEDAQQRSEDGSSREEQLEEEEEEEEEDNAEEWAVFVESAGDTACDLFFLYDACGGEESRAFLQSLGQSMQRAVQQGDAAGAEVLLLLTDALVEGLNCIPVPLAPLFLCLPALPRTSAPCAAAAAKLLKKAAIHFTEEDPEYDGLLTAAPHAAETATPCGTAMLKRLWIVALQTLLQLLPLHPRLGADSILQLATWGGHHLGAAAVGLGGGAAAGGSAASAGGGAWGVQLAGVTSCSSAGGSQEAAANPATARGGGDSTAEDGFAATFVGDSGGGGAAATEGSDVTALQQLEMFCAFVEQTGPHYSVQVDATLHAAAVKLVLTSPRKEMPVLFNRSMRGTRQLLQHCLALADGALAPAPSSAAAGGDASAAAAAAAAVERRRCVSRALQRLESCCSALCGGKVYISRSSSSSSATAALQTTGGGVAGAAEEEEEESREAAVALQCFLGEGGLWMSLLQVMRATLLNSAATALPINAATKQRVHFGLLIDLKSKEPLQQPQENDAVLVVLTIRCLRQLLRGLGTDAAIALPLWAAVAELVADLITNALHLVDSATAAAAAAATSGGEDAAAGTGGDGGYASAAGGDAAAAAAAVQRRRSSTMGAQSALQACSVVLLGDLLRIASAGKSARDVALLHAAKGWAARGLDKITLLFVRLGLLLNARQNYYDVFSPYFDFLLAYAAAAAPGVRHAGVNGGGTSCKETQAATSCSSGSSALLDNRYHHLGSSHRGGSTHSARSSNPCGNDLQQDELFAQPGFQTTLQVAVRTLQRQDADTARQCIMYCHACSTRGAAPVDHIVEGMLPHILTAILNNLHCWGLENLSVLWKAFALWNERYHAVFLSTVYEWLAAAPPPSSSVAGAVGGGATAYGDGSLLPAANTSSCAGAGGSGSVFAPAAPAENPHSKALQPERLNAPQAAVWRGFQNRSLSASAAAGGEGGAAGGEGEREGGGAEEEEDGAGRLLRGMDPAQKEIVFCCFRNFRGLRMRQLLQDLCLIASGAMLPSDALVAYEYALQTEQKTAAKEGAAATQGGSARAEMED